MSDLCPSSACQAVRETLNDQPQALTNAGIDAALTFAWYAMPDFIRSRALRTVAKTGLLGLYVARNTKDLSVMLTEEGTWEDFEMAMADDEGVAANDQGLSKDATVDLGIDDLSVDADDSLVDAHGDDSCDTACCGGQDGCGCVVDPSAHSIPLIAAAVGITAGTVAVTVACEKWLFGRGERARTAGKSLPHLKQAIPLAFLAGAISFGAEVLLHRAEKEDIWADEYDELS